MTNELDVEYYIKILSDLSSQMYRSGGELNQLCNRLRNTKDPIYVREAANIIKTSIQYLENVGRI